MARNPEEEKRLADEWNARHPVGTEVRYWSFVRSGDGVVSRTRSNARMMGGHTAVLWVEGHHGCIALSHVEALEGQQLELLDAKAVR